MKHKWGFWWLGLCLAGIFWPAPVHAAGVQIESLLGFNGYIVPEHWMPFHIQLNEFHEPSARIEIVREEQSGSGPERIESFLLRGVYRVEIPVFAARNIKHLKVRVLAGDQLLAEQILDLKAKVFPGHLVLTVNIPTIENQAIERSLLPIEPVAAVPVNIHELPNMGVDYDAISCLVFNDPAPVLSPAQKKALRYWLAGGGKLVIFGPDRDIESARFDIMAAFGVKPVKKGIGNDSSFEDFSCGLGTIRLIRSRLTENLQGGNVAVWRKWLNLKPFGESIRLNAAHGFFTEPWGQKEKTAPYPFGMIALILAVWTGVALFVIWRRPKNLLASFLIFTLVCVLLIIPLAGYITSNWRRGALAHNRALILPDSGGMLLQSDIQMKSARGASPWGTRINFGRDEQGWINFRGRGETAWSHDTVYPWYSIYHWNIDELQLMGVFPDVVADFNPDPNLMTKQGSWTIPVTGQTVLWNGSRCRVLKNIVNGKPQWGKPGDVPAWLNDDEEWLRKLQALWPDIPWLCGRGVLPTRMQLRIQNGPAPEVFWAMPFINR